LLKKILFGTILPQEYICVPVEKFDHKIRFYLNDDEDYFDLTGSHLFIGYYPLIIAISSEKNSDTIDHLQNKDLVKIVLGEAKHKIIAQLILKKISTLEFNEVKFFIFEGVKGNHRFLSKFHILTNSLKYKLTADKKINIY